MFVQTYSYDNATVLITKKRLRECSLDISLPIETKTSHMHAHPSSNQRSKGCDVYIRGRESLTKSTQDFEFSISICVVFIFHGKKVCPVGKKLD